MMVKIKCEVCEIAEAEVLCCSDEAVLCGKCDQRVHAANKLSSRHHRLSLLKLTAAASSSSSSASNVNNLPLCDRCNGRSGYVFCLEERALLCTTCDESVHMMASPLLLAHDHQRFLIAGLKVSRDPMVAVGLTASSSSPSGHQEQLISVGGDEFEPSSSSSSWHLDEIFGTGDFDASHFSDNMSTHNVDARS